MGAIEINASNSICRKCGRAYGRLKGYFPVSYNFLYKGVGYLSYCKECVDAMYHQYLEESGDPKAAVWQMCRKLDLYWNEKIYDAVVRQNSTRSTMTSYITKINNVNLAGKCYDDSLREEGTLWVKPVKEIIQTPFVETEVQQVVEEPQPQQEEIEVPEDVVAFWGPGYTPSMYMELEQRRNYWMSRFPADVEMDIGTEALIRQICSLEIDINRDRAAGRSADKNINTLNTLLGSASLKPAQKKTEDIDASLANVPLGVWLYRYEKQRPLPEVDEDMKDVNSIKKYVFTWMGHLCKMMGIKNGYVRLYEDEVDRLKVSRPESDYDDEEDLLIRSYSEPAGDFDD